MKNLLYSLIFLLMMAMTACGGGGSSGGDEEVSEPDVPTNVRAMAGRGHVNGADDDYNYAVVRWSASSGADSYTIYYDTDSNVTTSSDHVSNVTNTYYVLTDIPASSYYYFAVSASNSAGESDLSAVKRMAVQIARTGQTTSYADNDDGDLRKGVSWSADRFIEDQDGNLIDTMTGLMWPSALWQELYVESGLTSGTWDIALNTYTNYTIGDYDDWHVPNLREFMSLLDYGYQGANEDFWTSTTDSNNSLQAWAVNGRTGTEVLNKVISCKVLPVRYAYGLATAEVARTGAMPLNDYEEDPGEDATLRNGVIWATTRFTDNGDGTVTDILTGLMWLQDAEATAATGAIWTNAVSTAAASTVGGYDDWRLPNVRELESLLDMSQSAPCLPSGHHFLNCNHRFWTSTTRAGQTGFAWYIDITNGSIQSADKDTIYYVWPVRSTQ